MTNERKEEILNNLISWIAEHDRDFIEAAILAMDISEEEAIELELADEDYYEDEDETYTVEIYDNQNNCVEIYEDVEASDPEEAADEAKNNFISDKLTELEDYSDEDLLANFETTDMDEIADILDDMYYANVVGYEN